LRKTIERPSSAKGVAAVAPFAFGCAGRRENLAAQVETGKLAAFARNKRLARSRGLAGIRGAIGVAHHELELRHRQADASAAICVSVVLEPWPMSTAPL
jgi:hypothetical protein